MGSNTSKPNSETVVVQSLKNESEIDNQDPRSPTPEIVRTPLQNKNGGKHNITKNVDLRKTFESTNDNEKLIHSNPILSAVIKNHLQSYDPRSPTQDFERTPIIIASKLDNLAESTLSCQNLSSPGLENDVGNNCDNFAEANTEIIAPKNLCNVFNDISLNNTIKENEEPLGSSTVSKEDIEDENVSHIDSKPTKLLETNFEYQENADEVFEDSQENNLDKINNADDKPYVPVFRILDDDPRSPSIEIERTPIVIPEINDKDCDDNVEDMSDDTLIKVLQSTNAELRQVNKHLGKADGILVYEDETANLCDTPKNTKSGSNSGSRTPLSCMKNKSDTGHARSKSANMLYNPKQDGQSKIPKKVSHIPRLKSLSKQTKLTPAMSSLSLKNGSKTSIMGGDCENTPPHSHRDVWDKNNSIVL